MNKFARNLVFSTILFCIALVFSPYTAMGDTNFPGNVTVTSNLVVKGTLTVSNNVDAIKDVFVSGSLAVTNIGPGQASMSLYLSGADSDDNGDGGKVLISGGAGDFYGDYNGGAVVITGGSASGEGPYGGDVILQGGSGGSHVYPGNVILRDGGDTGYVELQTSEGTTRFYLQQDGTLNANSSFIKNARILPQGDLTMGVFTNSP